MWRLKVGQPQHLPEEHRHRPLITKPNLPRTVLGAIARIQS